MIHGVVANQSSAVPLPTAVGYADFKNGVFKWSGSDVAVTDFIDDITPGTTYQQGTGLVFTPSGERAICQFAGDFSTFMFAMNWTVVVEWNTVGPSSQVALFSVWNSSNTNIYGYLVNQASSGFLQWGSQDGTNFVDPIDYFTNSADGSHQVVVTQTNSHHAMSLDHQSVKADDSSTLSSAMQTMNTGHFGTTVDSGNIFSPVTITYVACYSPVDDSLLPKF